ncbi:uncharacterized protein [Chironomus tepperi]|uniref:uncharacterized protein n=1 Tax=Chironomus tepperi TaxID=113505 RepID=UPI00391FC547
MEIEEKENLNDSTSNSEQVDSLNSSELDDAMNELLSQNIEESPNNSPSPNEDDLLDTIEEKSVPTCSIQKLKFITAKKIVKRAKYYKNYYIINRLESSLPTNERTNITDSLRIKTRDTLNNLDEKTGNLTKSLRLKSLKPGHQNLISKSKSLTPSSLLSVHSYESGQSSSTPASFPKAIVYPDTKKANNQSIKAADNTKMSFNEVFAKAAEDQIKTQKSIEQLTSKADSNNIPKNRVLPPKTKRTSKIESVEVKKEPFKYLIPQNLLASQDDKMQDASTSKSYSNSVSSEENEDYTDSVIPERPQINYDLIDALADYRVIAKYLFNKLNVPPIDFDGTDDYINLYKLSRN